MIADLQHESDEQAILDYLSTPPDEAIKTEFVKRPSINKDTFYIVHNIVFDDLEKLIREKKINTTDFLMYNKLRTYSNNKYKDVWPKISTLSQDLGMCEKTVRNSLQKLKDQGIINIAKDGTKNKYGFNSRKNASEKSFQDEKNTGKNIPLNRQNSTGISGKILPVSKPIEIHCDTIPEPAFFAPNNNNITRINNNNNTASLECEQKKITLSKVDNTHKVKNVVVVDKAYNWISCGQIQSLSFIYGEEEVKKAVAYIDWQVHDKKADIKSPMGLLQSGLKKGSFDYTEYDSVKEKQKMDEQKPNEFINSIIEQNRQVEKQCQERMKIVDQQKTEIEIINGFKQKDPHRFQEIFEEVWEAVIPKNRRHLVSPNPESLFIRPQFIKRLIQEGA